MFSILFTIPSEEFAWYRYFVTSKDLCDNALMNISFRLQITGTPNWSASVVTLPGGDFPTESITMSNLERTFKNFGYDSVSKIWMFFMNKVWMTSTNKFSYTPT